MNNFGKQLKTVRKGKGLTLEVLASLYNQKFNSCLTKGALSRYENNKQEPRIATVINLSRLLNVSTDYLLMGQKG